MPFTVTCVSERLVGRRELVRRRCRHTLGDGIRGDRGIKGGDGSGGERSAAVVGCVLVADLWGEIEQPVNAVGDEQVIERVDEAGVGADEGERSDRRHRSCQRQSRDGGVMNHRADVARVIVGHPEIARRTDGDRSRQ